MKTKFTLLIALIFVVTCVFATEDTKRTCPPCPYHPCPTDFVTLIKKNITISVPGQLPIAPFTQVDTIQDALTALENYKITNSAIVTIQLIQNMVNYDTINITHSDGDKIHLIGNCKYGNCTIRFKSGATGIFITNNHTLGLLDNFNLIGSSTTGAHGIFVTQHSSLSCGSKITVKNFDHGIYALNNSYIDCAPSIESTYNLNNGVFAEKGSHINIPQATLFNNQYAGIRALGSSNIDAQGAYVNNNGGVGIGADCNSHIDATKTISENNIESGFMASEGSSITATEASANNNCNPPVGGCGQFTAVYNSIIWAVKPATAKGTNPSLPYYGGRICNVNGEACKVSPGEP